jgi:hypothetical protein
MATMPTSRRTPRCFNQATAGSSATLSEKAMKKRNTTM